MDVATTISKNEVLIRLTEERWKHIVLAVSALSKRGYLVVVYKEVINDGFIITAFGTTDTRWLFKKEIIWSKPS